MSPPKRWTPKRECKRATVCRACLALFVVGCGQPESAEVDERIPVVLAPADVAIADVETLDTGPRIAGALRAREQSTIIAQVAGAVLVVNAELGERVKRGQTLARIDPGGLQEAVRSARASVESARCAVELAARQVERSERLVRLGALAEQQLELDRNQAQLARAQHAEAKARLALARETLSETRVRAPIDGVVSEQSVYAGDVVAVGSPLFTIIDPSSLRLEASVPSAALRELELGTQVDFQIYGQSETTLHGEIARIAPAADPLTGQIDLLVTIPNSDNRRLAGLFAEGRIVATRKRALAVPQSALDWTGDAPAVTAIRHGNAARLTVEPGIVDDVNELVEIRSGIELGERVVLGPAREISPGTPVRVSERREERPAQARAPAALSTDRAIRARDDVPSP